MSVLLLSGFFPQFFLNLFNASIDDGYAGSIDRAFS
jgi:hypothetical protein